MCEKGKSATMAALWTSSIWQWLFGVSLAQTLTLGFIRKEEEGGKPLPSNGCRW